MAEAPVTDLSTRRSGGTRIPSKGEGESLKVGQVASFDTPEMREDIAKTFHAMKELEDELKSGFAARPEIRVGIHAGPLVVGEVGDNQSRQFSVIGDTVNMASRLETTAAPGTVYVPFSVGATIGAELAVTLEPVR